MKKSQPTRSKPYERIAVMKQTCEDWYPSYVMSGNYMGVPNTLWVDVAFLEISDGTWRVSVSGNDDFGMGIDYAPDARQEALDLFLMILTHDIMNKELLAEYGLRTT